MPNYDSTVKAVLHSSYLPKMPLEKSQVKFKSRSEVMPVFKLYLWHHPWETFGSMANFLYNSSFSRNTRYPYIGPGFQLIITKIGANEDHLFQNTKTTKFYEITFSKYCSFDSRSGVINQKMTRKSVQTCISCPNGHANFG